MFKLKKKKIVDEAIAWQELAEKLTQVYAGVYTYTNIIEALAVAEAVFDEYLKEENENEKKES